MTARADAPWAVFIDRDGVIVEAVVRSGVAASPRTVAEMRILPGAAEAVEEIHSLGGLALVVTNQPDVGRGDLDEAVLAEMHAVLRSALDVDDVMTCPHSGRDMCPCRKPAPGMLMALARRHHVDLASSWTVGDRWVDIAAGAAAGTRTVLIEEPYSWSPTSSGAPPTDLGPDAKAPDILGAADVIAGSRSAGVRERGRPARYIPPIPAQELKP